MAITCVPIATATPNGANVQFNSIPSTYDDLYIVGLIRGARTDYEDWCDIRFNNNTDSLYSYSCPNWQSTSSFTPYSSLWNGATGINYIAGITGSRTDGTGYFGSVEIYVPGYSRSDIYKTAIGQGSGGNFTGSSQQTNIGYGVGIWTATDVVTSITLKSINSGAAGFSNGTRVTLYGIKNSV